MTDQFIRNDDGTFSKVVASSNRIIDGCTLPFNGGFSFEVKEYRGIPIHEETVTIPKALYDEWVAAQGEALNWADANARAFAIETAPRDEWIDVWCSESKMWYPVFTFPSYVIRKTATHWRPLPPPPSNPPLPEPLERLGEVLRRVKGA